MIEDFLSALAWVLLGYAGGVCSVFWALGRRRIREMERRARGTGGAVR